MKTIAYMHGREYLSPVGIFFNLLCFYNNFLNKLMLLIYGNLIYLTGSHAVGLEGGQSGGGNPDPPPIVI